MDKPVCEVVSPSIAICDLGGVRVQHVHRIRRLLRRGAIDVIIESFAKNQTSEEGRVRAELTRTVPSDHCTDGLSPTAGKLGHIKVKDRT